MTFSLLVRDKGSVALGAAVASRFFAVGALCIHVEGGVAALATQALVNPMYAAQGMARLRAGEAPDAVVAALTGPDPGRDQRQLHIIDARGHIVESEVVRSSNSRFLDQRALAIAQAAAPFGGFSDDMKSKADQIVVTSRFRFTKTEGMQATMTNSGG